MPLLKQIEEAGREFAREVEQLDASMEALDSLRIRYLGRKGKIPSLFDQVPVQPKESRSEAGMILNNLKKEIEDRIAALRKVTVSKSETQPTHLDLNLPGDSVRFGTLHPVEHTMQDVKNIFTSIGFSVAYGPEIDDDYHNFEALNIPKHHPARDMQDTFYVSEDVVLRTHTSNTQIHIMEKEQPPLRVIVPGRVYRNEAVSVRSYCLFHQVEGLYINRSVSFAELKGTLEFFVGKFFGDDVKFRFRPSFFPFTEPSAEVDISCLLCGGSGCPACKNKGWVEILGCGMVDPEVFRHVGYDPEEWTGYAFGMGIEKLAMLKYQIDDIRLFFNSDVRFLRQFV
ncbi:MAG: phenylalanine--tRNA ligase subunit alpha [Candidatus Neomarinimicrobiota bacterium]